MLTALAILVQWESRKQVLELMA